VSAEPDHRVPLRGTPPAGPKSSSADARWERLAKLQHASPWRFVVVAFLLAAAAFPWLRQLELNSDFTAMLPESVQSVRDLDEIRARFGGTATLALAVQSTGSSATPADRARVRAFVRELVPRIEAHEELDVASIEWNVADFETFVEDRRFLYADLDDLVAIRDALRDRVEWERARANPFYVDLGDEPPPDPESVIEDMRRDADEARSAMDRFPEGFYEHPRLAMDFVFVRTSIRGGESGATDRLLQAIESEAEAIEGRPPSASRTAGTDVGWVGDGIRIDYGGEIMDVREENEALRDAVERSTIVTVVLLLCVIFVFFMRARAVPLLLLTLVPPCFVTFGAAEVVVDYLNASSAFLGSIVVGNGVNASIMWLGRYFEERREGRSVEAALSAAHTGTSAGTFAATIAAMLAYGSLMVTDYRGFRDFGFIGALGMLLCWVAAYALLPALAVITERMSPLTFKDSERRLKGVYGILFARLALSRPRAVVAVSVLLMIVLAVPVVLAVLGDPLEYDFRNMQAERRPESRVTWVNVILGDVVGETEAGSALAILAPSAADVPTLRAQLERYRENHPDVLGAVRTIDHLMPHGQEAKREILAELRDLLLEVRPHVSPERQAEIDEHLPPETIPTVTVDDLPESVARPFIERDGTRGRLVFVEHAEGQSTWDGRYMARWSEAVRSARTDEGRSPAVAGAACVFADLLGTIFSDGPKAIGASFIATALILLFTFRRNRERLLALASMIAGVVWMVGLLAATGTKLNFLNMVALPITFGIGVEYGVNFVKRFLEEKEANGGDGTRAVRAALEGAGGAVILCSLTTLIGYISLYTSANRALNSFGLSMSLGELTCLVASVISLPAAMYVLEARSPRGTPRRSKESP
jgi:predicted RND superfamily exporter protein